MSEDLAENNMTVATDQEIWQAWLAKKRAAEERLERAHGQNCSRRYVCADNVRDGLGEQTLLSATRPPGAPGIVRLYEGVQEFMNANSGGVC